eukprot:c18174_g1_i6.p1 GENE.c18174_g1_i6~~c18174_g1_i6.p1  ORF type:complete len:180 (+),score=33.89 c18174_g1_i6:706-1245(+)
MQHGALVNMISHHGQTPLHWAASHDQTETALLLLREGHANVTTANRDGNALHSAARSGCLKTTIVLVEWGCDVNAPNPHYGETALHVAANNNRVEVVKYLMANGANINALDICRMTARDCAIQRDLPDLVAAIDQEIVRRLQTFFLGTIRGNAERGQSLVRLLPVDVLGIIVAQVLSNR